MSMPRVSSFPCVDRPVLTTASTTPEAEPTSGTDDTRSSTASGHPGSPAVICHCAPPAILSHRLTQARQHGSVRRVHGHQQGDAERDARQRQERPQLVPGETGKA
jgi:hypothetical protein